MQTSTVASGATQTVNFPLVAMGSGTVSGTAYVLNHLVLAHVCASVGGDDTKEYVDIYNPTESTFTMLGAYDISYVKASNNAVTQLNNTTQTSFVNNTLYPHKYYMLASYPTINGVSADAYYNSPTNRIPQSESGGIEIVSNGVYETASTKVDAIGWGRNGSAPYGPATIVEGNGLNLGAGIDGLDTNQTVERKALPGSTETTMSLPGGADITKGNGYDSNDNSSDWVFHNNALNATPQNTSISELPQSGTPAAGALVFMDDGLSSSRVATSTGGFAVPSVATGTWSILISTNGWSYSRESAISVTNAATTSLGNILIISSTTFGYASGRVVTSGNVPINLIPITTSGGNDTTDTNGYYRMSLAIGTYTIVANSANAISQYTMESASGVVVNAGIATDVPDIVLYQGGKIRGWVTTNGTDALPGVPIIATSTINGEQFGTAITDSQGYFNFSDLPVGSYVLSPQLETGETPSPLSFTKTVVANSTVFAGTITVSNAFGTISGTVKKGTVPITTGVLIVAVASPTTIDSNPPAFDSSLRSGSVIYYSDSSDGDGNYRVSVRAGTYNLYAWYTTYAGNTPTTTKVSSSATIAAGGSATVALTW